MFKNMLTISILIIALIFVGSVVGCPESNPPCKFNCNVETDWEGQSRKELYRYSFVITCESGNYTENIDENFNVEGKYDSYLREFKPKLIKVQLECKRTYKNSGNIYNIVGHINIDKDDNNKTNYRFVVTGGIFGNMQEICER